MDLKSNYQRVSPFARAIIMAVRETMVQPGGRKPSVAAVIDAITEDYAKRYKINANKA